MACPFCAIVERRLQASIVAENETAVAFMDLRQAVPGHVLVVPRRHVEDVYAIEPALAGDVMALATRVARALRDALDPPGLNLWQSNGAAGGQEVGHFHLHVQPRRHDDGLLRIYPGEVPAPERRAALEQMATGIRRHIPS